MSSALVMLLAGLGLFFYGLRNLLRAFESFASSRVRPTLQRAFASPWSSWFCGAALTLFSQSGNLSVVALMGLTEMGFIGVRSAYFATLGASAGTTAWLWFVVYQFHLGAIMLACGAFGLMVARTEFWQEIMNAIFSVGLALFGIELLFDSVEVLFAPSLMAELSFRSSQLGLKGETALVLWGSLLGLVLQSVSAPLVLVLLVAPATSVEAAVSLFLGANLGLTLTGLIMGSHTRVATRRLARANLLIRTVAVLGTLFLFPTFIGVVERVSLFFIEVPNLMTKVVVAQLLFNLVNSLIFGALADPILRFLAFRFPEREVHTLGLAQRVKRMLYQDPELAAQELERQLRILELEVKANYDRVMLRLSTVDVQDSFKERALRERNFRAQKFTIHDLLFAVDRHSEDRHDEGSMILSLLEYYGALTRTLFHLEDHYEKGLSKRFRMPSELQAGIGHFKALLDDLWEDALVKNREPKEHPQFETVATLEEIVLQLNRRLGVEYQGYSTWLMELAGYLRLTSSDLGQLLQRRLQLRALSGK